MKHYVFCAANIPENQEVIDNAIRTVEHLEYFWDMDATVTGCYEGSKVVVNKNDGNNTSIYFEDDDIHRLIESCMAFVREKLEIKYTK